MTLLIQIVIEEIEKIIAKNTEEALHNKNANKTTVILRRTNCVFIVG